MTQLTESTFPITINNPIRILHVDDDTAFLSMAKQCLELECMQVESASSVSEALKMLNTKKFDAVVSDYLMPGMDGLELLKELKAAGNLTPFILFSGQGRDEVAIKALNSGAFRYMDKRGSPEATFAELASCIKQATDLARAEALLKQSEKRFRAIFDSSIDAILVLNDAGEIVYSNKAALTMLHYAKDEIVEALNKHFNKQFTAAYEQNMLDGFGQLSDGNLSMAGKTVELVLKKAKGQSTIVELSFSAFTENGMWYGVSIVRDVSERRRQELLLEKSQRTLNALFSFNPEAIVFTDKHLHVTEINQSFTELFGYSFREIKGKNIREIIVPEGFEDESEMVKEQILKGFLSLSTTRKKRDGTFINVSMSGGPLIVDGSTVGFFMVYVDISDIVTVQNELEKALEKAKLLNEKILVLGGFTRHDVRNKLSLIQGNLYLAKKKCGISPDLEGYLKNVEEIIENIIMIFDSAKTYEMIGSEEIVSVDAGKMVQNAVSLFSDLRGVKVENNCFGFKVMADSLLVQVFFNLIDNSLKYGEKITKIKIYHGRNKNNSEVLYYEDDGVGIDTNLKQHLFQKGFGKGTGYGLYLIRKISEVYGWTVQEKGEPGKGVKFEFTIAPFQKQTFDALKKVQTLSPRLSK
jgi:PAS domain S-box-containing protein